MKAVPTWVYYSVLRVLMFAVPLGILLALQIVWWLAAILAAVIGLCLSYIFLRTPRESVARDLYAARHRTTEPVHPDDETEDAALDRLEAGSAPAGSAPADSAPAGSEREGETQQHPVGERGQAGELKGKNQLP